MTDEVCQRCCADQASSGFALCFLRSLAPSSRHLLSRDISLCHSFLSLFPTANVYQCQLADSKNYHNDMLISAIGEHCKAACLNSNMLTAATSAALIKIHQWASRGFIHDHLVPAVYHMQDSARLTLQGPAAYTTHVLTGFSQPLERADQ